MGANGVYGGDVWVAYGLLGLVQQAQSVTVVQTEEQGGVCVV